MFRSREAHRAPIADRTPESSMSSRIRGAAAALLVIAIAGAWRPLNDPLKLRTESRLWFEGTSTVRDWKCEAKQIDARIDAEPNAIGGVLKGTKAVKSVTLVFPTAKLDCANGTMNGHMMKALHGAEHDAITFVLTGYDLAAGSPVKG